MTELFARAGGGGSGGGGSGGGDIFVLIGYLPAHFWGSFIRRKIKDNIAVAFFVTIVPVLLYAGAWVFVGGFGAVVGIFAIFGGFAGLYGWFGKAWEKMRGQAKKDIVAAASVDPAWDEKQLTSHVQNVFMKFQSDWSNFNFDSIKTYTTQNYSTHTHLMLAALHLRKRRNLMQDIKITELYPVNITDSSDNSEDKVRYYISASANDSIVENFNGEERTLFTDKSSFFEFWTFARTEGGWMLDSIRQGTVSSASKDSGIEQFAKSNNLYYSADWGWLLLPSRGQLFGSGKFGKSDINNHVIGVYNNLLIELYTYAPDPHRSDKQYTIAQVALPKRYDSVIVEAKKGRSLFHRTPKGYNKLTLEWPDFNKRYNVYATNVEQVTAFELLHPVFMEKLFALNYKVSIEVVENVVYLYSDDISADYISMYAILQDAFKEMRL